jgi:uridine kinase
MLYLGILFSVFLLLAPPQPGYVLWALPFIIHYFCRRSKVHLLPWSAFVASYLGFVLLRADSDLFDAWKSVSASIAALPNPYHWLAAIDPSFASLADNLMFTVMEASLGGIVLYMYMMGVRGNIAYRMRTNPVMIGIAGDSGAGKDTLAMLLCGMFEKRHTTVLAGDDYHRWERGHEAWKRVTHLNAEGNRLHDQQEHAFAMLMGESVRKPHYDHDTGRFTSSENVDPNHIVIFQGLHSLSTPEIRRVYDLKIFLDPDESLRYGWKIQRDGAERGHSAEQVLRALNARSEDRSRYILPQKDFADVVVRWLPDGAADMVLEILALNSFNLAMTAEYLSLDPELVVEHTPYLDATMQKLRIRGTASTQALYRIREATLGGDLWLRNSCTLSPGLPGCLQLILFFCLREKLRWSGQPVWLD